ncbi:sialate O-acetylesterase [Salegentibacter sp. F188]|uniref:Sialate O-acetylesterase n=1 Tax=Autumnicola patrickiae TaxID=3075591 RepID=A0ABU3E3W7_9FLAO|nr:sialate O-acetylesterase [Salegentibacter sp. F188]MDT0690374.1 sialate O-acetylesterase [Salegentibacter sp. F188]
MRNFFIAVLFITGCYNSVISQVRLPALIDDGMVLQRDADVKIWGWASNKEPILISFQGKEYKTTANSEGKWSITVSNLEAGGPYRMSLSASNNIELKDIYVGDVWLASGQSNMELPMGRVEPLYVEEIANASNESLRFFQVPKTFDFNEAREDLDEGAWKAVNSENIRSFSAVAYFFAKDLYERYDVPVGIINASLGGSPVEAWISEESLKQFPVHYQEAVKFRNSSLRDSIEKDDQTRMQEWYKELNTKDSGLSQNWKAEAGQEVAWKQMEIPGYWADNELGQKNGAVWFQKKIEIPEDWAGEEVKLLMGRIVDADSVFVNGTFVGNTTYQYPPRRYEIPAGVLEAEENLITVRIINESGRGGFVSDKPYKMELGEEEIDLTGTWKYKLGAEMPPLRGQTFIRWKPLGLYNAMINPLKNYRIKGAIWYQGESNTDSYDEYQELFSTLIEDWRKKWGQGNFPFLYVQLTNFMESKEEPGDSNWARLREAQTKTLSVPETGMAVAIDVGEWNDIHPLNKKSVGERLAQAARNVAYNEDVVPGGPVYSSFAKKGDSIIISFENVGQGLTIGGDKSLNQFAIAGEDKKFYWANAEIKDNKVIVSSPKVKNPVAVRYAWADNPEGANLYNEEGLPASPFRTDDWEK